ncbi:MAG: M23 family metallopeptidase [Candidatus Margulisbacteria bacterium]|nr:M23 family metallopeptidase [Candidatus Margulisiibacteriota bacterium]
MRKFVAEAFRLPSQKSGGQMTSATMLLMLFYLAVPAFANITVAAPQTAFQGQSFYLSLFADKPVKEANATFQERKAPFFPVGDKYKAILGTMPECKPGEYTIAVKIIKEDGSVDWQSQKIKILAKDYGKVSFYVKPAKKKAILSRPTLVQDEWAPIEKTLVVKRPERFWEGKFIKPVPGITTMDFGVREYINDKKRGYHRGHDFRAAMGTPVMAPNDGEIVYASQTQAFGGTVVIDHGQGIHTLYFHLSEFLKPVGTMLKKGDFFARTGNSGISSGPHLHWGMSVQNVRVDPMQWTREQM